jgi:Druantia protein DruA
MNVILRYRGREVGAADVDFINEFIAQRAGASRRALSIQLCEAWGWTQPNGQVCDVQCRGLMLALHRAGHIELPAPQWRAKGPARRTRPVPVAELDTTPIECGLRELGPLDFLQVRRTKDEPLVQALLEQHHYLGYVRPVGEHLKYLVSARGRPIACFCWSSAPRHLGPRDRFIGWKPRARRAHIHYVAYQPRYLIMPWVRVPHLASHLLGIMTRRLSHDWEQMYAHPVYLAETFVDPELYRGTCYRAANWTMVGMTTGRGKDSTSKIPNRSLKQVYVYPLAKRFRARLGGMASS